MIETVSTTDQIALKGRLGRFGLDDKIAMVVGGAGGIGSEICRALAEHGASVAVLDVRGEEADAIAREIQMGGQCSKAYQCDVCSEESVRESVSAVFQDFERIDVLVGASGAGLLKPLLAMSHSDFYKNINMYLTSAFATSTAVGRQMIRRGGSGSIIHISSISSIRALGRGTGAYAAAKAGLNALVRELAVEWAEYGIRVNAIAPGQIYTPGLESVLESGTFGCRETVEKRMIDRIPMQRIGAPRELAGPCLFLASKAASYVTGQVLFVDGGNSAQ